MAQFWSWFKILFSYKTIILKNNCHPTGWVDNFGKNKPLFKANFRHITKQIAILFQMLEKIHLFTIQMHKYLTENTKMNFFYWMPWKHFQFSKYSKLNLKLYGQNKIHFSHLFQLFPNWISLKPYWSGLIPFSYTFKINCHPIGWFYKFI